VTNWKISKPQVFVLDGGRGHRPNAVSFAQGLQLDRLGQGEHASSCRVDELQGLHPRRRPDHTGMGECDRRHHLPAAVHAHKNINATVEANDGLAEAVVTDL